MDTVTIPSTYLTTKIALESERRDVKDIWNEAIKSFTGIVGQPLQPTFSDSNAIEAFASEQINAFHKFRYSGAKTDKLRELFMKNIELVESGAKQLVSAASAAFPPAAAIGTAFTMILAGCKAMSADYDVVTAFFEDMKNFLEQVSIIETRLPRHRVYQTRLMDVFTSLLSMCGFATKYIQLGRFKKWIINVFTGQEKDLAHARKNMTTALTKLQSAAEYAILANTEDLMTGQHKLTQMQSEINESQIAQLAIAESQKLMLQVVIDQQVETQTGISEIKNEIKAMFESMKQQEGIGEDARSGDQSGTSVTNRIRSLCPVNDDNDAYVQIVKSNYISGTYRWLLDEAEWNDWLNGPVDAALSIEGPPGIGKTYMAYVALQRLQTLAKQDSGESFITTFFFFNKDIESLSSIKSMVKTIMLQISEQNLAIRQAMEAELSRDNNKLTEETYFEKLIIPLFQQDLQHQLYILVDGSSHAATFFEEFHAMKRMVQNRNARIKFLFTSCHDHLHDTSIRQIVEHGPVEKNYSIMITKEKVLKDMEIMIAKKMQSRDSAYLGLAKLRPAVKALIAKKMLSIADGPLYMEQALKYLSSLGREGAVLRELKNGIADDISSLFTKMLKICERRTPSDLFPVVKSLLSWLSCCFGPLSLDQANAVSTIVSGGEEVRVEEEIFEIYHRFIGLHSNDVSAYYDEAIFTPVDDLIQYSTHGYDGDITLYFTENAMRNYFHCGNCITSHVTESTIVRTSHQESHAMIFLHCCEIIGLHASRKITPLQEKLFGYALKYCLRHWLCSHTADIDTRVKIYEALADLLSDRQGLASMIESSNPPMNLNDMLGEANTILEPHLWLTFSSKFGRATLIQSDKSEDHSTEAESCATRRDTMNGDHCHDMINGHGGGDGEYLDQRCGLDYRISKDEAATLALRLSPQSLSFWKSDPEKAFLPLAMCHITNWLSAKTPLTARRAYAAARQAIHRTCYRDLICSSPWPTFDENPEIEHMLYSLERQDAEDLRSEILRVRDLSTSPLTSNSHFATASLFGTLWEPAPAIEEMRLAFDKCIDEGERIRNQIYLAHIYSRAGPELIEEGISYMDDVLASMKDHLSPAYVSVLVQKSSLIYNRDTEGDRKTAIDILADLRMRNSVEKINGVDIIHDEWVYRECLDDWQGILDMFLQMTPMQRLSYVVEHIHDGSVWHKRLVQAAQESGRLSHMEAPNVEIVEGLEVNKSGVLWANNLAFVLWRVKNDPQAAELVLMRFLDKPLRLQQFRIRNVNAGQVASVYLNMTLNILYRRFRMSKIPEEKLALLELAKGLPLRPMPLSVQLSVTSMLPHLVTVANMMRRMGMLQDYQNTLQQAFEICWANLHDDFHDHDEKTLQYMSRVVAHFPSMTQEALILSSSQIYYVGRDPPQTLDPGNRDTRSGRAISRSPTRSIDRCDEHERIQSPRPAIKTRTSIYNSYFQLAQRQDERGYINDFLHCTSGCGAKFKEWDEDHGGLYTCQHCAASFLCGGCYKTRMERNKTGCPEGVVDFCCTAGEYLKTPVEGWKGITDGYIVMENKRPILFSDFLEQTREKWNMAWEEFWSG